MMETLDKMLTLEREKYFNPNGKLVYEGYFKDNKIKRGKKFYPDGTVMYEGNFKDYDFDGRGKLFHENGRLRYEGNFAKGQYNGEGKVYNFRGKLQQEGYFIKNERIQNKKTFDVLQNEETYGVNFLKKRKYNHYHQWKEYFWHLHTIVSWIGRREW